MYDALELEIIGQKREYVRGSADRPIDEEVIDFINRIGRFESDWVRVVSDEAEPKFVRYDRISAVTVRRGLDEDLPGLAPV